MSEDRVRLTEYSYECKFCGTKSRMIDLGTSEECIKKSPVTEKETGKVLDFADVYNKYQILKCTNSDCNNINILEFEYFICDSVYIGDEYFLKGIYRLTTRKAEINISRIKLRSPIAVRFIEEFVKDDEMRKYLLNDLTEAIDSFNNGAYKATIVLCGSVLECILIYTLDQENNKAVQTYKQKFPGSKSSERISEWNLHQLLEVAKDIGILQSDGNNASTQLKDYRNIIHFNQWIKKGYNAKETTSASMMNNLEIIFEDILKWYAKKASDTTS